MESIEIDLLRAAPDSIEKRIDSFPHQIHLPGRLFEWFKVQYVRHTRLAEPLKQFHGTGSRFSIG